MVEEPTCRAADTASEPLKSISEEVRPLRWHWKCLFDNIWRSDLLGGNEWRRTFYLCKAATSTLTSMYGQIHLVSMCLGSVCMCTWMETREQSEESFCRCHSPCVGDRFSQYPATCVELGCMVREECMGFACLSLPIVGITLQCLGFLMWALGSNSGPCVFKASTLPTAPSSPQPTSSTIFFKHTMQDIHVVTLGYFYDHLERVSPV